MEFRSLGRTGVQVSSLCLGCMMFGGRTGQETSTEIIAKSLDGGINFLDTANVYNLGRSEEATGVALKQLVVATASSSRPRCTASWMPRAITCAETAATTSSSSARSASGVSSAIISPRTVEQIEDNLGSGNVEITDEGRECVDTVVAPGRMVSPFYEVDFGSHRHRV
jgi:aryl-alcohol dehydrogenase-like predicted oxidoreductase